MNKFASWRPIGLFLLVLCVHSATAQPAPSADQIEMIDFVVGHLGFSPEHREAVLAGQAVFSGMSELEHLEEEVAAAGAMLLVRRTAAPEVIEAFLDTEVFKQVHDLARYDPIAIADESILPGTLFAGLEMQSLGPVSRIIRNPAGELNLGRTEATLFAGLDRADGEAVNRAMRQVLDERLSQYVLDGLEGIEDYVRPNGDRVSPAYEIRSGLSGLSNLNVVFGDFLDQLGDPVHREDELTGNRRLHWVEKSVADNHVVGLLDQSLGHLGDRGIAVEIHYYASAMYNAMVTLVAALPYGNETLVFAINHTYTDRVTGFGSAVRRRLGRAAAASALADHLERVRERLEQEI